RGHFGRRSDTAPTCIAANALAVSDAAERRVSLLGVNSTGRRRAWPLRVSRCEAGATGDGEKLIHTRQPGQRASRTVTQPAHLRAAAPCVDCLHSEPHCASKRVCRSASSAWLS